MESALPVVSVYAGIVTLCLVLQMLCLWVSVARNRALRRELVALYKERKELSDVVGAVRPPPPKPRVFAVDNSTPIKVSPLPTPVACVDETGSVDIVVQRPGQIVSSCSLPQGGVEVFGVGIEVHPLTKIGASSYLHEVRARLVPNASSIAWLTISGVERLPGQFFYRVPRSVLGVGDRVEVELPFLPGLRCRVFLDVEIPNESSFSLHDRGDG